jgi:hypothetical protein
MGARYLSQRVKSPLVKSLIYTAAISAASWATSLLRERLHEQTVERGR